jgi:hypothetical protein
MVLDNDVHAPRPRFPFPTNGREERRGVAGRRVIECYRHMASFYGVPDQLAHSPS